MSDEELEQHGAIGGEAVAVEGEEKKRKHRKKHKSEKKHRKHRKKEEEVEWDEDDLEDVSSLTFSLGNSLHTSNPRFVLPSTQTIAEQRSSAEKKKNLRKRQSAGFVLDRAGGTLSMMRGGKVVGLEEEEEKEEEKERAVDVGDDEDLKQLMARSKGLVMVATKPLEQEEDEDKKAREARALRLLKELEVADTSKPSRSRSATAGSVLSSTFEEAEDEGDDADKDEMAVLLEENARLHARLQKALKELARAKAALANVAQAVAVYSEEPAVRTKKKRSKLAQSRTQSTRF